MNLYYVVYFYESDRYALCGPDEIAYYYQNEYKKVYVGSFKECVMFIESL